VVVKQMVDRESDCHSSIVRAELAKGACKLRLQEQGSRGSKEGPGREEEQ
jgi:hypothetical protein